MTTGFSNERADQHEKRLRSLVSTLAKRDFRPKVLDVDGDRPDIEIYDRIRGCAAFVDLKTRYPDNENYSIKAGSLETYWRITLIENTTVYIVWDPDKTVDNVFTLQSRIEPVPYRPTRRGSLTDWLWVKPGGAPFDKFFPAPVADVADGKLSESDVALLDRIGDEVFGRHAA